MSEDMRHALTAVRTEIAGVAERLDGHDRRFDGVDKTIRSIAVEQARARGDIEWLKDNMVTRTEYKAGMDLILGKLDGIAGKLEDSRYDSAKNLVRLDEHERRIKALETKPS